MTTWWNNPASKFLTRPVRARAAKYADARFGRDNPFWMAHFRGFIAGWTAANRVRFPELRAKIKAAFE